MEASDRIEFWKGQLLEVQTDEGDMFQTEIVQIANGLLYLQKPINRKKDDMHAKDGMPVKIYFYHETKGLCVFHTQLLVRDNRIAVSVPALKSIKKAQRRRFFRVPVETEFTMVPDDPQHVPVTWKTYDLSGGGLSFLFPDPMEVDQTLKGTLVLKTRGQEKTVSFHGRIVNCIKHQERFYKISIEFLHLKESVRSEIIKYCLFKQIELRNKLKNYPI